MMENEPPTIAIHDDGKSSKRGRIMGKLFGRDRDRDRKGSQDDANAGNLNDFLHGPSDTLSVSHAAPPMLTKLDTKSVTRYPNALHVQGTDNLSQPDLAVRLRSHTPMNKPNKKGLVVRFTDAPPDVMGEGGDECEAPVIEIAKRRRPRPPLVTAISTPGRPSDSSFEPAPLRRTQTGHSTASGSPDLEVPGARSSPSKFLGAQAANPDERRRSIIEIRQAKMLEAEGQAFQQAVRAASGDKLKSSEGAAPGPSTPPDLEPGSALTASPDSIEMPRFSPQPPNPPPAKAPPPVPVKRQHLQTAPPSPLPPPPPDHAPPAYTPTPTIPQVASPDRLRKTPNVDPSPTSVYSAASSFHHPFSGKFGQPHALPMTPQLPTTPQPGAGAGFLDVVNAAADDAMNTFVERIRHLFELFRLHAESVRPLLACTPNELARAALWWFLTGRTALENTVRERPTTPESQRKNEVARQQAYTDLAKGYWLMEEALPEILNSGRSPTDREADDVRTTLFSSLKKLAISMKRNGFLPPEEAFLPQTLDRTIWIDYPQLPQDIKSMLWGFSGISALSQNQLASSGMSILETIPLGDSASAFCFGRFRVDLFLMEQGRENQRIYLPCYLSIVRPLDTPNILFVTASQNGTVQLRISGNKQLGPVWEDVQWHQKTSCLEVKLSRGFLLMMQSTPTAFTTLRSMYDFSNKVHASLFPKSDENVLFKTNLRAFQYIDNDPQARQFPKESQPNCDIALFERVLKEGAATGPRTYHRGYRIAVVTGPKTKTLSGVNQVYNPLTLIQFGFLRSDAGHPALSLKFENGRQKGNMVMSFADDQERARMHTLLIGTALGRDEQVCCETPLQGVWFSERFGDAREQGLTTISRLPWTKARVINQEYDSDRAGCILSEHLRVVFEFKDGTFTDRINVAPGELKLRLDVQNPSCMMLYRQPQVDTTLAVTEANVSRDLPPALARSLDVLKATPTIRTFMFPKVEDLHKFESAITGFTVLFDGIAATFAIARRRMVVPIHKKWEAGATRIQVVQQDGATQILAFFSDFSHGQCMGFHLKGTDVFESFGKPGKAGLKIVDAKFPLPKVLQADHDGAQEASETAFLCLDLPELPGEHDDISIVFESEAERDKLISCLPAPVKGSRLLPKIKGMG
ncbi:hypothetical protein QBC35DRAFT_374887 [Podospora australis]|uniref:Uncharacterized protein n=1 Tax=Podospora australis TaxID=1536484 RepID=A0AAN6X5I9_9PEZI|nr:hypothetical protein QBC35DRAFT_374887 [Podospora australis]